MLLFYRFYRFLFIAGRLLLLSSLIAVLDNSCHCYWICYRLLLIVAVADWNVSGEFSVIIYNLWKITNLPEDCCCFMDSSDFFLSLLIAAVVVADHCSYADCCHCQWIFDCAAVMLIEMWVVSCGEFAAKDCNFWKIYLKIVVVIDSSNCFLSPSIAGVAIVDRCCWRLLPLSLLLLPAAADCSVADWRFPSSASIFNPLGPR